VNDDDVGKRDFQKARHRADAAPRFVHIGHRFEEQGLASAQRALRDFAGMAGTKRREFLGFGNRFHRHESDIVPVAGIGLARIAKPGNEQRIGHGKP
jgi:hypothetical protein